MKSTAPSGRAHSILFFFAGLLFTASCVAAGYLWMRLVPYRSFDAQPMWLQRINHTVGWLPWLICSAILALNFVRGRRFHAIAYAMGTITPYTLILAYLALADSWGDCVHHQTFDSRLWRNQETTQYDALWPPRLCMVDDLVRSDRLAGLTKSQVVHLLGLPRDKAFLLDRSACEIDYYLGPARGFCRIDSEWLYVSFDNEGRVDRYWVAVD